MPNALVQEFRCHFLWSVNYRFKVLERKRTDWQKEIRSGEKVIGVYTAMGQWKIVK